MPSLTYRLVRVVRHPIVLHRRRQNRDKNPDQLRRLETAVYRRSAMVGMASAAVDPHYFHRADLAEDSLVVDIGAFDGLVAKEFLDLYGCEVHSYEPHPDFFAKLAARFANEPRVHPHPFDLGAADAVLPMQSRGLGSTAFDGSADDEVDTVEVHIRDVAAALEEIGADRIDYVKINIEGAEFDLLDRMFETGWIDRSRYVLIQLHEWFDSAHLRRWRIRRRLRRTHTQVWNHPWVYELWCSKDVPHPPPRRFTKAEMRAIKDHFIAEQAAADRAAAERAAAERAAATSGAGSEGGPR